MLLISIVLLFLVATRRPPAKKLAGRKGTAIVGGPAAHSSFRGTASGAELAGPTGDCKNFMPPKGALAENLGPQCNSLLTFLQCRPSLIASTRRVVFFRNYFLFLRVLMSVTVFAAGPAARGVHAYEKPVFRHAFFFAHPAPQPGVLGRGHCGARPRHWCQHRDLLRGQRRPPASATL